VQDSNGLVMQVQGASNYCGLCCINNVIGPNDEGAFTFTADEVDQVADSLWLDLLRNHIIEHIRKLHAEWCTQILYINGRTVCHDVGNIHRKRQILQLPTSAERQTHSAIF